jgi:hypothetical protein
VLEIESESYDNILLFFRFKRILCQVKWCTPANPPKIGSSKPAQAKLVTLSEKQNTNERAGA